MNVTLPEKNAIKKRQIVTYVVIMLICIVSIIIAFYVQFYARIDIGKLTGIAKERAIGEKSDEQINALELSFDQLFTNSITNSNNNENKKVDIDKDLVYTEVEKKVSKLNSYDIDVNIPKVNIEDSEVTEFNTEIQNFIKKTDEILASENKNIIYTVEYAANVENDILSLMIRSNLKVGSSAQRVIIETFNYDLRNNKKMSLDEILNVEYVDKKDIQNRINSKIATEQRKVEDLKKLGYTIYSRDISSDKYKIQNTREFYFLGNVLYIMYPYGNSNFTSEMDLIII